MSTSNKTIEANGFTFEIEVTGIQNVFRLSGTAKRAGKVVSSDLITGERANNWIGLFIPFKDEGVKLAEKTLIDKLSKQGDLYIQHHHRML